MVLSPWRAFPGRVRDSPCAPAEPDVAKLAAGLTSGKPHEQHAAADALADLGSGAKAPLPQLAAALEAKDAELRWRAARALGMIGDPKAIESLRKHAADADPGVRAQSIFALARLRAEDQPSLAAVIARLTDPEPAVRRATVAALRMLKADRDRRSFRWSSRCSRMPIHRW